MVYSRLRHTAPMTWPASRLAEANFEIEFDEKAREWLGKHPSREGLVIAFEVHRCCNGARVCDVRLRKEHPGEHFQQGRVRIGTVDGRGVFLDSRIATTMPRRIPVSVGGVGPFKGLRLKLTGPEWGRLLYS